MAEVTREDAFAKEYDERNWWDDLFPHLQVIEKMGPKGINCD